MSPVTIRLHGVLNRHLPDRQPTVQVALREPATAGDLMARIGVPVELLDLLVLNGRGINSNAPVAEGDLLEAFPFIGGG